jgi:hypothetical protein
MAIGPNSTRRSTGVLKLPLMLKVMQKTQALPVISPDACSDHSLTDNQQLLGTNFTEETYYA